MPMSSQIILSRWDTWLLAAIYTVVKIINWQLVKSVMMESDKKMLYVEIENAQKLYNIIVQVQN